MSTRVCTQRNCGCTEMRFVITEMDFPSGRAFLLNATRESDVFPPWKLLLSEIQLRRGKKNNLRYDTIRTLSTSIKNVAHNFERYLCHGRDLDLDDPFQFFPLQGSRHVFLRKINISRRVTQTIHLILLFTDFYSTLGQPSVSHSTRSRKVADDESRERLSYSNCTKAPRSLCTFLATDSPSNGIALYLCTTADIIGE